MKSYANLSQETVRNICKRWVALLAMPVASGCWGTTGRFTGSSFAP